MPPLTLNLAKMKELKPSGLFYVPVPENIKPIVVDNIKHFGNSTVVCSDLRNNTEKLFWIDLPKGDDYEIIGIVTAEHIDFDCNKIVESEYVAGGIMAYKNYTTNDFDFVFATDSLRSLLTANDVHFFNPYDEKVNANPHISGSMVRTINRMAYAEKWQEAESKLVEKILILKPL